MVDFVKAIQKPFSDNKNMLIGMVIGAVPVLNLLVSGYALKNAEDTIKGKKGLTLWAVKDVVEYIVKLIISAVISIVYLIIPMILIGIGFGSAMLSVISNGLVSNDPNAMAQVFLNALAVGGPLIILGVILGVIAALLTPMANMKWLKSGKVMAAFNIADVVKNALTADYIVTLIVVILYGMILMIVAGIIAGLLGLIPIIGIILTMLVMGLATVALSVSSMSMFAQTVK